MLPTATSARRPGYSMILYSVEHVERGRTWSCILLSKRQRQSESVYRFMYPSGYRLLRKRKHTQC